LELFQKAAAAGNTDAMNQVGVMYRDGLGAGQDYSTARDWFQKAADAGNNLAMNNLGVLYETGKGVVQDMPRRENGMRRPPTPETT
jgi:TPR repeat protein